MKKLTLLWLDDCRDPHTYNYLAHFSPIGTDVDVVEIETTDAYSVFQYYLVPTFELTKEILSNGPFIEVLRPLSLREEIMDTVKIMRKIYK
jgi:predicted DNA-binding transcriptional regulator YafY